MADVNTNDIAGYGAYLKAQGVPDTDIQGYTKYLADHHDVDHPSESSSSWLGTATKALDSVTGAPTRAAIYAAQNGQSPWTAFKGQFANMNQEAPTGKDIAAKTGVSTEPLLNSDQYSNLQTQGPTNRAGIVIQQQTKKQNYDPSNMTSPAGVVGQGIDLAANPLNLVGPGLRAAGKAAEAIGPIADSLSEFANDRALKAAGAMKKDFNMIQNKGIQDSLGSFLLDKKIVTPIATVSKVADRLQEAKQAAGETIGHILDTSDAAINAPKISARDIALKLSEDPEIMNLHNVPGKEGTSNQINNYLQTLYNNGDSLSLRDAQKLRQGIDSSINFNKRVPEMAGAQPYLYKMRDALSEAMNSAVNALPNGGEADRLKIANANFSKLATLDKIAQNRLGALSSNEKLSLSDKVAAGLGAALGHGNPIKAGAAAMLNKTARSIGPSLTATAANKASQILTKAPAVLSKVPDYAGPAAAAAIRPLDQASVKWPTVADQESEK